MSLILFNVLSVWITLDGIISLYLYRGQTALEQGLRMVRALIGIALLLYGMSIDGA